VTFERGATRFELGPLMSYGGGGVRLTIVMP
jgi:hypothetical protein